MAVALCLLAVACGVPLEIPAPGPGTTPGPGPGPPAAAGPIARFVELLDDERARRGCPRLAWDPGVAAVAAAHSRDMVERGYFSHVDPDGRDPFARLSAAGIRYTAAAENIAFGRETGHGVFAQWMGSPGHRDNMLQCRFTHHGVGLYGSYWTHVLTRPPS